MKDPEQAFQSQSLSKRHLVLGWSALLLFASLGLFLEGLHAFKSPFYLDVDHETRRLLWRLGHAHGALLALMHVALAASLATKLLRIGPLTSHLLTAALVLLPAGFLWGGASASGGDPGAGIALVPLGALALLTGLALVSWQAARRDRSNGV